MALRALRGPDKGVVFLYPLRREVRFGRRGTEDHYGRRPRDAGLSRNQFLISHCDGDVVIESVGAAAQVNGKPLRQIALCRGDVLQVGTSEFEVALGRWQDEARGAKEVPRIRGEDLELISEVGLGAFGRVFEARERRSGRRLCVKRLRRNLALDSRAQRYLARELRALARVQHPGVVGLLGHGVLDGQMFLALEWIDGPSLFEHVAIEGPLSVSDVVDLGVSMLDALVASHAAGVLHRDVNPANVQLEGKRPVLIDFGLARFLSETLTPLTDTGEMRGTIGFAAPECLLDAKRADVTADIYGVAATLYFAGEGLPPGPDAAQELRARGGLGQVLSCGLELYPSSRYQRPDAMLDALRLEDHSDGEA